MDFRGVPLAQLKRGRVPSVFLSFCPSVLRCFPADLSYLLVSLNRIFLILKYFCAEHFEEEHVLFLNAERSGDRSLPLLLWLPLSGLAAPCPAPYVWTLYRPSEELRNGSGLFAGRREMRLPAPFQLVFAAVK